MKNIFRILSLVSLAASVRLIFSALSMSVTAPYSDVVNIGLIADRQLYLMLAMGGVALSVLFVYLAFKGFISERFLEVESSNKADSFSLELVFSHFKNKLNSPILIAKFSLLVLILISLMMPWTHVLTRPSLVSIYVRPEPWVVFFNLTVVLFMLLNIFSNNEKFKISDFILSYLILAINIIYGLNMDLNAVRTDKYTFVTDIVGGYYVVVVSALALVVAVYYENKKIQLPSIDIESYVQRFEALTMRQKVAAVLGTFVLAFISFLLLLKVFG